MVHSAEVTAGMPFVLKLSLQSYSALLQTLEVALKDSTGFVTSGPSRILCHTAFHVLCTTHHVGMSTLTRSPVTLCDICSRALFPMGAAQAWSEIWRMAACSCQAAWQVIWNRWKLLRCVYPHAKRHNFFVPCHE